jgi:hypothetical protein
MLEAMRPEHLQGTIYVNINLDADHVIDSVYERRFFPDPRVADCMRKHLVGVQVSGLPPIGSFLLQTRFSLQELASEAPDSQKGVPTRN